MRELKLMLAEVSGVATRVGPTIWTTADEGALSLANAELDLTAAELGKWNELGWYIPKRWTPHHLLHALGYPDKARLFVDYPLLTRVVDLREESPSTRFYGSVDPSVGAAAAPRPEPEPPPPIPDPELPGEELWMPEEPYEPAYEVEEARVVPISPMMLTGAAVAVLGLGFAVVYAVRS
jgi:hypothetical protein